MFKKWWFYAIIFIVIIILIPLIYVLQVSNTHYDVHFNYQKFNNPLADIVKRNAFYDAASRSIAVKLDHDTINSLIKDNMNMLELDLPEKFSIQDIIFNPTNQTLYLITKYGKLNIPVSAKINFSLTNDYINIYPSDIKLGNKRAPKFITNRLPIVDLTYTMEYKDLEIPQIAYVQDVHFGTGTMNVNIQLVAEKVNALVTEYRTKMLTELTDFKSTQSPYLQTFIDKLLSSQALSDDKVANYVDELLSNEEIMNSVLNFATASNLNKYVTKFEEVQFSVTNWVKPLEVIKYHGTIDTTVENILYNQELQALLSWVVPENDMTEYKAQIESYYHTYKTANTTFETLSATFEGGNIEEIIEKITKTPELVELLAYIMPEETINDYLMTTKTYFALYKDIKESFEKTVANMDTTEFNNFINELLVYADNMEETRTFALELVDSIDPVAVKETVTYLESNDSPIKAFIADIDKDSYKEFSDYIDNLESNKTFISETIRDADLNLVSESADAIDAINKDVLYLITLLKRKNYDKALDLLANDKIRFYKAKKVIDQYL